MEEEGARRHGRRSELDLGGDLVSTLPDDLLLHVLVRLRCARAAARTSLLSRRWHGLWTRLPDLVFRGVAVRSIQPALGSLLGAVNPGVSLLDIAFTSLEAADDPVPAEVLLIDPGYDQQAARVSSLLHAAAGLAPMDFSLSIPLSEDRVNVDLPRFHRATSIQLHAHNLRLMPPRPSPGGGFPFPALERLSLSGCWVDLAALVLGCPCLRVLWVNNVFLHANISIQSESLQELFVRTDVGTTDHVNIDAPMLKQLTLYFHASTKLRVSVVAPLVEKVSWECSSYSLWPQRRAGLAPWCLWNVSLRAATILGRRVIIGEDNNPYVLSLQIGMCSLFDAELNLAQHIEKHLVTDFSVLDLKIGYGHGRRSTGHVFGPFVLHLLGMPRIRTATRRIQIRFPRSKQVIEECSVSCPCDEPKNWRSKTISMINLEEVDIDGFEGEDHECDFLKVIFRSAPMLKRMNMWITDEVTTSCDRCTKIHDIFNAYPFVECKLMPY